MDSGMDHLFRFCAAALGTDMRTTLTLDDDSVELARNFARANGLRLGQAMSELIRRASAPRMKLKKKGEFWVIAAEPGAPKVTSEQVKALLEGFP
jgi:hypothetical protein